ncbi:MAG: hypothetical protein SFW08_02440 [Gemmatimonadaceae bacterium]|nr:hypothetical protein [Gemmatimonadaceae bacterium]
MNPRLTIVPGGAGREAPDDDARVASELRALLVPPRGAEDFAALEARILMAATRPNDPTFVLARWARPALVAAAAALLVAVAAEGYMRQRESRMAVMNAIGVPAAAAAQSAMNSDVAREATLRQLLEP